MELRTTCFFIFLLFYLRYNLLWQLFIDVTQKENLYTIDK